MCILCFTLCAQQFINLLVVFTYLLFDTQQFPPPTQSHTGTCCFPVQDHWSSCCIYLMCRSDRNLTFKVVGFSHAAAKILQPGKTQMRRSCAVCFTRNLKTQYLLNSLITFQLLHSLPVPLLNYESDNLYFSYRFSVSIFPFKAAFTTWGSTNVRGAHESSTRSYVMTCSRTSSWRRLSGQVLLCEIFWSLFCGNVHVTSK